MNFGELKNRLRDLDFAENTDIAENIDLLVGSLNSALTTISTTIKGITDVYEYTQDGTQSGNEKLDLLEATVLPNGEYDFDVIEKVDFEDADGFITTFNNYRLVQDKIFIFDKNFTGKLYFYYRKRVPVVDKTWADTDSLPIFYECEPMLPLLTAYYMWLDDDIDYATRWYNEYDTLKQEFFRRKMEKGVRARIRTDMWSY